MTVNPEQAGSPPAQSQPAAQLADPPQAEPWAANPTMCSPEELRTLFLFEKLSSQQLAELCAEGRVEYVESGVVFNEGDPAKKFYVLMTGAVVLSRRVGSDDVEVIRTDRRGVYAGAFRAFVADAKVQETYSGTLRVAKPSRFFVLSATGLTRFMREWFPMALHLLEGLFYGVQNVQRMVDQRERLLALGSLSAGLTHELNNPAAAAVRATASLRERVAGMRHKLGAIAGGRYDRATLVTLIRLQEEAAERVPKAPALDPIATADAEDAVADWLDQHGIAESWDLAPVLVQAGLDTSWLDQVAAALVEAGMDESTLEGAVRWLNYTVETELLMNEIEESTNRISTLVGAAKQYSQLDRAPYQVVDVHDLLDSTLVMLSGKIGPGVTVVKDYDPALPPVPGYPAELNQVWTNLIDNAVSAMSGNGTLTLRTARDHDRALIEFRDTGPGVPTEIKDRIFEPFFTTKAVGEGTGLGLDISWRIVVNKHHGDLQVESVPGDTRFRVRLPFERQEPDQLEPDQQETQAGQRGS
ncbi:MAG TPA: ATP-binding protein [Streptosporangiaceae bacterium]